MLQNPLLHVSSKRKKQIVRTDNASLHKRKGVAVYFNKRSEKHGKNKK